MDGIYQPIEWVEIKEEYLPNGQEKAILILESERNEYGRIIGPSIIITYDGTDEDFIKKYNSYISPWNTKKAFK